MKALITLLLLTVSLCPALASPMGEAADSERDLQSSPESECGYDKGKMMALDEERFDQDVTNGGGGWRAVAAKDGCELIAADLLRDYRTAHADQSGILSWHEGQLRANVGDYHQAIPLMEESRKPATQDPAGWNPYVDATVAFLRKNQPALMSARKQLAQVPPSPDMPPVREGFIELPMGNGQTMKMRWPPNLDVVDGLIRCFDKPYSVAYANDCRAPSPKDAP